MATPRNKRGRAVSASELQRRKQAQSSGGRLAALFPSYAKLLRRTGGADKSGKPATPSADTIQAEALRLREQARAHDVPSLPIANLLPSYYAKASGPADVIRPFIIVGAGLVIASAVFVMVQVTAGRSSNSALEAATARLTATETKLADYKHLSQLVDEISARQAIDAVVIANRVQVDAVYTAVSSAMNASSAALDGFEIKPLATEKNAAGEQVVSATPCGPLLNPFNPAEAKPEACLTFSGHTENRAAMTAIAAQLQTTGLMVNLNVAQTNPPGGTTDPTATVATFYFTGSAGLTKQAMMKTGAGT